MKRCISCGTKFDSKDWKCPACQGAHLFIEGSSVFSSVVAASSGCFKAEYFHRLARLEANNFWFCSRNKLIIWAIGRFFSDAKNYLEIGCGTGFVLSAVEKAFPNFSLYGTDIYVEGLKIAKERLRNASLLQVDARLMPYKDKFDVIGAFDVLEHIKEDDLVLSQMHGALRNGGGIILTVPQHAFLWGKFDDASCHLRRYDIAGLKTKVEYAGFEIIKMTSFVSLLLPLMVISRLWQSRERSTEYDLMQALEVSPLVNILLEKILDFERALIRLGACIPFGGSIILLARKI